MALLNHIALAIGWIVIGVVGIVLASVASCTLWAIGDE